MLLTLYSYMPRPTLDMQMGGRQLLRHKLVVHMLLTRQYKMSSLQAVAVFSAIFQNCLFSSQALPEFFLL